MKIIEIFVWSIIVTLAFVYAVIFQWIINPPTVRMSKVVAPTSTPENQLVENAEKKEGIWALRWKDGEGEVILTTSTNKNAWLGYYPDSLVVHYKKENKDLVAFFKETISLKDDTNIISHQLVLFDVLTKKSSIIFELEKKEGVVPQQLVLIGDTVYFSFTRGEDVLDNSVNYIDLSENNISVKKIMASGANHLIQRWGYYWLEGGYGHAGAYDSTMVFFDTVSKKTGEVIISGYGGEEGSDLLGVTKDGMVVIGFKKEVGEEGGWDITVYNKVTTHLLNNENKNTVTLFDVSDMPTNVEDIFYREEENDLYLVGDEVWLYDFDTKNTVKIRLDQSMVGLRITKFFEGGRKVCLSSSRSWNVGVRAIWNTENNSVDYSDVLSCESKAEDESIKAHSLLREELPLQLEVVEI